MNKDSLLLPENYDKMKIQKFLMCCECPADTEIAVSFLSSLSLPIRSFSSHWRNKLAPERRGRPTLRRLSSFLSFINWHKGANSFS